MNKWEFLSMLRDRLGSLPEDDIRSSVDYYSEMIDDRMEEGLSEEESVAAVGSLDEIISQICVGAPSPKSVGEDVQPEPRPKRKTWKIVFLAVTSPVWLVLLAAALLILVAFFIVVWSLVIVVYAATVSFAAGAVACILGAFLYLPFGTIAQGMLYLGTGLVCAGITVFLVTGSKWVSKAVFLLNKKILLGIKTGFVEEIADWRGK